MTDSRADGLRSGVAREHSRRPRLLHLLGPRRPRRPGTAPPWPVLPAAAGRRADRSALRSLKSNRLLHTAPISQSSETSPFDNPVRNGHRAGRGDGSLRTTQTKPRSRDGFHPETTSACYQSPGSSQHLCARVRDGVHTGYPDPERLRKPSRARQMRAIPRGQVNVLTSAGEFKDRNPCRPRQRQAWEHPTPQVKVTEDTPFLQSVPVSLKQTSRPLASLSELDLLRVPGPERSPRQLKWKRETSCVVGGCSRDHGDQ